MSCFFIFFCHIIYMQVCSSTKFILQLHQTHVLYQEKGLLMFLNKHKQTTAANTEMPSGVSGAVWLKETVLTCCTL